MGRLKNIVFFSPSFSFFKRKDRGVGEREKRKRKRSIQNVLTWRGLLGDLCEADLCEERTS